MLLTSPLYINEKPENATTTTATSSLSLLSIPNNPFYPPLCSSRSAQLDNSSSPVKKNLSNNFWYSPFINNWFFPQIMTTQFWFDLLCKPEVHHLHLGLFFLGSLNNVFTAYTMMSDVFDMITANPRRELKQVVLVYASLFVACFWFHYNISAFRVSSTQVGTKQYILVY